VCANSPQAKGRVERAHHAQDRLRRSSAARSRRPRPATRTCRSSRRTTT
jgi:hypothetical protein